MMISSAGFFYEHVELVYAVVFFLFGAAVGSFLNVVICRLPYSLSLLDPPSSCPKCGRSIFGLDNLPVFSWIILKGRCRQCKEPIHWRYPAIELLTAILWSYVALQSVTVNDYGFYQNIGVLMVTLVFVAMLVVVTFIDFDHQIIPDEITLGGMVVAVAVAALLPDFHLSRSPEFTTLFPSVPRPVLSLLASFAGAAMGAGSMFFISLTGTLVFRAHISKVNEKEAEIRSAIGLGDVKLMGFMGAMLGWREILAAFCAGTCFGAFAGIFDKLRSGRWPNREERAEHQMSLADIFLFRWSSGNSFIPYGPFLAIGALFIVFSRDYVMGFFLGLFAHLFR
jgi:leader peptidase (prepilin peptidase)/N-methyltransferase